MVRVLLAQAVKPTANNTHKPRENLPKIDEFISLNRNFPSTDQWSPPPIFGL
jgi:hypothetical protein